MRFKINIKRHDYYLKGYMLGDLFGNEEDDAEVTQ